MLLDLKIINGEFTPKFSKYVDTYSVTVASDINQLEIDYKLEKDSSIEIINNENLQEGINFVYIEIKNDLEMNTYTLEVYKEKSLEVINYDENIATIEIDSPMPNYIPPLIIGICFSVILITYLLIFKKRKRKI